MSKALNSPDSPWGTGYLPSLDGWRALSILLVLGSHSRRTYDFPPAWNTYFDWMFDGGLGVRCFFVISGFLITTLMLRESGQRGKVDLRGFYLRRAIRILPVYSLFLLVVGVLQITTAYHQQPIQWFHLISFTSNFSLVENWLTGHTWSLSCEEQFYLIWPVLYLAMNLKSPRPAVWVTFLIPLLLCPLWRVACYLKLVNFGGLDLLFYLDSLAVGCLLAYLHPWIGRNLFPSRVKVMSVISMLLIVGPYVLTRRLFLGVLTVPLGHTSQAIGMALLISFSIHNPSGLFSLLNRKPVIWLGQLSYSLYIWQQFFCAKPQMFGWDKAWFQSFPVWIVAALATACASYYLLERPLVAVRKRLHRQLFPIQVTTDKVVQLPDPS